MAGTPGDSESYRVVHGRLVVLQSPTPSDVLWGQRIFINSLETSFINVT